MRRLLPLIFLLLAFSAGCTPRHVPGPGLPMGDAASAWNAYAARSGAEAARPFRLSATLRYTDAKGETVRVSSLLWGNGRSYPLRLDLTAGMGTTVAKIRESADSFTAYSPEESTAYVHDRAGLALSAFGVPIPLTLHDLSLILTGRSGDLFLPPRGETPAATPSPGGYVFNVRNAPLPGLLELSPQGFPLSWQQGGWRLTFEPLSDNPMRPHRIEIAHPQGAEALIVVRDLEYPAMPFAGAQFALPLPPGTQQKELPEANLQ